MFYLRLSYFHLNIPYSPPTASTNTQLKTSWSFSVSPEERGWNGRWERETGEEEVNILREVEENQLKGSASSVNTESLPVLWVFSFPIRMHIRYESTDTTYTQPTWIRIFEQKKTPDHPGWHWRTHHLPIKTAEGWYKMPSSVHKSTRCCKHKTKLGAQGVFFATNQANCCTKNHLVLISDSEQVCGGKHTKVN